MGGRRGRSTSMRAGRWAELALLAALALFSVVPLVIALRHAAANGLVWTGSDGPFVADQFQYMSWIRELGAGGLAANALDIEPSARVFWHPMFALSGLTWQVGAGMAVAYGLWKPVAAVALFLGFRAYVARFLQDARLRFAALVLALFYAGPAMLVAGWSETGSLETRADVLTVSGEMVPATLLWGYLPAAISVALMPLFLLGVERLVRTNAAGDTVRRRDIVLVTVCGLLASWLHPWQGEVLLVTVFAGAALARFARPYRVLALPVAGVVLPLAYYFLLSRADEAWSLAAEQNAEKGSVGLWAVLLATLPLALPALLGLRGRTADFGERMLWLWPLAVLPVYLVLSPSFPQHAFEGISLPLAILATRGLARLRRPVAVAAAFAAALTVPGVAYHVDGARDTLTSPGQARYLQHSEDDALEYLDAEAASGGVLTTPYLGPLVPAMTGRQTWVGHPSWTRDYDERVRRTSELFAGRLPRDRAIALVRESGAAFVLSDCGVPTAPIDALRPLLSSPRRFGCASVYRVSTRARAAPAS